MAANLAKAGDLAFSEAVYVLAARGGRATRTSGSRKATLRVERERLPLREVLAADPALWKALDAGLRDSLGCDAAAFFRRPLALHGPRGRPRPGPRGPVGKRRWPHCGRRLQA